MFWSLYTVGLTIWITAFVVFRQDKFVCLNDCGTANIVHPIALSVFLIIFFSICIVMLVNYIIISAKLKQRNSMFAASVNDENTKMTKASC